MLIDNKSRVEVFILGMLKLVALTMVNALNTGLVLSMSWNLFMPQYFHLPKLSFWISIALGSLISIVTVGLAKVDKDINGNVVPVDMGIFIAKLIYTWWFYIIILIVTKVYY